MAEMNPTNTVTPMVPVNVADAPPPPGTGVLPAPSGPLPEWTSVSLALQRLLTEFATDPNGTQIAVRALKAILG